MSQVFLSSSFHSDPRITAVDNGAGWVYVAALTAVDGDVITLDNIEAHNGSPADIHALREAGLITPLGGDRYRVEGEGELWVRQLPEGETAVRAYVD